MKTPYAGAIDYPSFTCVSVGFIHSQDAAAEPPDFAKTNSVTLLLAEADRGFGPPTNGLEHLYWEKDGLTIIREVEGIPCRCLNITNQADPRVYVYFTVDPSFKLIRRGKSRE